MTDLPVTAKTVTEKAVTIMWTPPAVQEAVVPYIDDSIILTDGKAHWSTVKGKASMPVGRPQDGKPHQYGVICLPGLERGSVTVPELAPTPPSTVSNSLTAGATLTGTVAWTVETAGDCAAVEFWADLTLLATVPGGSPYSYQLDTTKLSDGDHLFAVVEVDSAGVRHKDPDRRTATVTNTTTSPPAPPPTGGTLVNFGDNGALDAFAQKSSSTYVKVLDGAPGGGKFIRLTADSNAHTGGAAGSFSTGLKGFSGKYGKVGLNDGDEAWVCFSLRRPVGFVDTRDLWGGLDIHQSSDYGTTGPAPVGGDWEDEPNDLERWLMRGANNHGLQHDPFHQTAWGQRSGDHAFQGGPVVATPGRWIHQRAGFKFDRMGKGWFQLEVRFDRDSAWRLAVPKFSGIYLGFDNTNRPDLVLYGPKITAGETVAIDYAHMAFSDDYATLAAWQDARLGV